MRASLEKLQPTEASSSLHWTFLIPENAIKKGRPHGDRYGKTPEKKEYHQTHNLKKRCIKTHFKGIHDRFLKDPEFRKAMLEHDRDEELCTKMDELADKGFSHYMTESESFRFKHKIGGSLSISLETLDH